MDNIFLFSNIDYIFNNLIMFVISSEINCSNLFYSLFSWPSLYKIAYHTDTYNSSLSRPRALLGQRKTSHRFSLAWGREKALSTLVAPHLPLGQWTGWLLLDHSLPLNNKFFSIDQCLFMYRFINSNNENI